MSGKHRNRVIAILLSLCLGSCPHEPISALVRVLTNRSLPWFVSSRTNLCLGSCPHEPISALVRVLTNQSPVITLQLFKILLSHLLKNKNFFHPSHRILQMNNDIPRD